MIDSLGKFLLAGWSQFLELAWLARETLVEVFRPPYRYRETMNQLFFVANQSLPVILFCVCFAAMVTILESSFHMRLVIQNDAMVPGLASVLILKELAVVVTALLLTSRVGAGIAAEVGTMTVTEQIDALRMLGIRPINYIVVPRLIACVAGMIILTVVASVICLFVAALVSESYLHFTLGLFVSAMNRFVHFRDLGFAVVKGACFGFVIPVVSCQFGFNCRAGAQGVGSVTTNAVVASSVIIIVVDFFLSFIFSFLS